MATPLSQIVVSSLAGSIVAYVQTYWVQFTWLRKTGAANRFFHSLKEMDSIWRKEFWSVLSGVTPWTFAICLLGTLIFYVAALASSHRRKTASSRKAVSMTLGVIGSSMYSITKMK